MRFNIPGIRLAAAAATVLTLAVGVACGGSGGDSAPADAQVDVKAGATTAAAAARVDHAAEIDQQNMTFAPARVSVKVGETVLIKNSETVIHTGNINGKNITGNMKKGDSTAWTATEPGEYTVTCDYHPQMKATISVSS